MKFENTKVMNFEGAFRGLRNPLESWHKSDSVFGLEDADYADEIDYEIASYYTNKDGIDYDKEYDKWYDKTEEYIDWLNKNGVLIYNNNNDIFEYAYIGPKDLDLAHRMIKAGTSDSKFLRQIFVSVDITAPLYWWKEMDTYKIGTVANSTSTMHKLASTPITIDCFETDDLSKSLVLTEESTEEGVFGYFINDFSKDLIKYLEILRTKYIETKDKKYWKELIRWLPNGWLQIRTWSANYAVLRNIYFQRQHHKLTEWKHFCNWVEELPYSADLITYTGKENNEYTFDKFKKI